MLRSDLLSGRNLRGGDVEARRRACQLMDSRSEGFIKRRCRRHLRPDYRNQREEWLDLVRAVTAEQG
jgi:hypothetical protein